jgi:hypothetical protein
MRFRIGIIAAMLAGCADGGGKTDTGADTGLPDSGSGEGPDCDGSAPGSLEIVVTGPGLDVPADVVVLDASGAEIGRVDASTTLEDLPPGFYTVVFERGIRAAPGARTDEAHGALHDTVVPVCVGREPATVTYDVVPQPSSGHLWVSAGEHLAGYAADGLADGAELVADAQLDVRLTNDFRGIAFDPSGNLWAATSPTYGTKLRMFRPDQLTGTGEQAAALEITAPVLGEDFASIADLWVSDAGTVWVLVGFSNTYASGLYGWSRADLVGAMATGGSVDLAPTWLHTMPELLHASDLLVVDDAVFVSVFDANRVYRYAVADLEGAALPSAQAEISFQDPLGTELRGPTEMAYVDGRIWLTLWTSASIVPFSPTADGAQVPGTLGIGVTDLPSGMDADATGTVWWGNLAVSGDSEVHALDGATGADLGLVGLTGLEAPVDLLFDPR